MDGMWNEMSLWLIYGIFLYGERKDNTVICAISVLYDLQFKAVFES